MQLTRFNAYVISINKRLSIIDSFYRLVANLDNINTFRKIVFYNTVCHFAIYADSVDVIY